MSEVVVLAVIGLIELVFLRKMEDLNSKMDRVNEKVEIVEQRQLRMIMNIGKRKTDKQD